MNKVDEIKQELIEWDELVLRRPELKGRCGKWPEWVRSLIGEVERLNIALHTKESYNKTVSELYEENEALRKEQERKDKALELIAHSTDRDATYMNPREIARQELEREENHE